MKTNEPLVPLLHVPGNRPDRYEDPLDFDTAEDVPVLATRRSLMRVALVAAEAASRFAREGIGHDAMAWMLAPRRLYGGECALDACLDRKACLRTMLLHGLSVGLDAEPEEIDELMVDGSDRRRDDPFPQTGDGSACAQTLYTSVVAQRTGTGSVQSFDAIVAGNAYAAASAFAVRRGVPQVDLSEIEEGFDRRHPVADALLSPAVCDMLAEVAAAPWSDLAAGLSVSVEQRFAK